MFKRTVFDLSKPIIFAFIGYLAVLAILALAFPKEAQAERIKDIAMVAGARSNQLIGFGLALCKTQSVPLPGRFLIKMPKGASRSR